MSEEVKGVISASLVKEVIIKGNPCYRHTFKLQERGEDWFSVIGHNGEQIPIGVHARFVYNAFEKDGRVYNNVDPKKIRIENFSLDSSSSSNGTNSNTIKTNNSFTNKPQTRDQDAIIRQNSLSHAVKIVLGKLGNNVTQQSYEQIINDVIDVASKLFPYSKDGVIPEKQFSQSSSPNVVADDWGDSFDDANGDVPF